MTVFSKIIAGEIPCYKVAEDEYFFAFLDINPLVRGHVLVVPKKEEDYLFDLDDETLEKMILFSKRVAKAIEKAIECKRVGLTVIGLEVPHAHIHLVPISNESDICFGNPKKQLEAKEMETTAFAIASYFNKNEKNSKN